MGRLKAELPGKARLLACVAMAGALALVAPSWPAMAGDAPGAPPGVNVAVTQDSPQQARATYLAAMKTGRPAEGEAFLGQRFDSAAAMARTGTLARDKEFRAFLMTPREEFVLARNAARAYEDAFFDIGFGVTITDPSTVMLMTRIIDVQPTDKVLEIGTGSGYQSAVISQLTGKSYSIEVIAPLAERTRSNYERLIKAGYAELSNIHQKQADGYWGWEQEAPFDKIIVTCAIDHVPPSLLQQLAVGGIMIIPVGPPGKQTLLKITKLQQPDGTVTIKREDVYKGARKVRFVPFTRAEGGTWSGRGLADR
jgi:protein-L-isoaspartate(D-aspartate) O-methyltransferase